MIAGATALDKEYFAAVNRGDVDGTMALFWNSPEVVSIGVAGAPLRGYKAVRDFYSQAYAGMPGAQFEPTSTNNVPQGDLVLGWGTWRATIPTRGGSPIVLHGRYMDVKARKDGKWVYIMDHGSVGLPPASETPAKK